MKLIYMEPTLVLMAHESEKNPEAFKAHFEQIQSAGAEMKATESGIRYIVIDDSKTENNEN